MYPDIDYSKARDPERLFVDVSAVYLAYLKLTGINSRDYFLDPLACGEMYRRGRVLLREMFGDKVRPGGLLTPYIAYGHLSALGARLDFPDDGEVGVTPIYSSIDEGIERLKKTVDFGKAGKAPFYMEFHRKMKEQFPDEQVYFAYSHSGPLTSAYLLRGADFLMDLYDNPEKTKEFLQLLTDSILRFHAWKAEYGGQKNPVNPAGGGIADDLSSLLSPSQWPEFVLPFWNRFFNGVTSGKRSAHCENLAPGHLPHLETIGLRSYDPFVSPKLDPEIIATGCRVPFIWGLPSFRFRDITQIDASDFVFAAAAAGAESVYSHIEGPMCNTETVPKVHAFIEAGVEAMELVKRGVPRRDLAARVNRRDFWQWWNHT